MWCIMDPGIIQVKLVERRGHVESAVACSLLKSPDLQAMDVKVLLRREWLVVKGSTFGRGAPVQLSIQPQPKLPTKMERVLRQEGC